MIKKIVHFLILFPLSIQAFSQTLKDEWVVCNNQGCKLLDPYYSDGVTVKWEGGCVSGRADGFGILKKYKNGEYESTYEGEYVDGIREGEGKFTHVSGSILECSFVNGQAVGYGKYDLDDGNYYEGDIVNYRKHGYGKLTHANGAVFDGFWVSDRMYTGIYTNYDGKVSYFQGGYPVDKIKETKTEYKPETGVRVTEYFDKNGKRCSQKEAAYYRLVTYESQNKPLGVVKDYYISGQLQSEFTAVYLDYDDEGKNFHEGEATWYFKNGKIEQKRYYFNNKINGKNTFYYENGQVARETNYDYGVLNGSDILWYKTGKPQIVALYENGDLVENKYIEYDENGLGALVYDEKFNENINQWKKKFDGSSSVVTGDDMLLLNITDNKLAVRNNYITLDQSSSYSIESIIQKKTGKGAEGYGILFGFQDWNNYYQFLISEYGSFIILGQIEGVNVNICDWTQSSAINRGNQRNLLKVLKFGEEFIFSINGEVVKRAESKDLRGNNFGIIASGNGQYYLENLIIKEFLTTDELAKRAPQSTTQQNDDWIGNGSGIFINEKGYIATNYHVIEDSKEIQVEYFQKGVKQIFKANVVVVDKQNDLAIIQIQDPKFKNLSAIPYVFGSSTKDAGTDVFALGYPIADVMGAEIKFTDGKISSKSGIKGDITVYQISVPIQPGNSGGPLFDNKGNLVGITSSRLNKEYYDTENVNYAIKTSFLKNLVDVMPETITLPNNVEIYNKSLTEKIKILSDYTPLIRVK